MLDVAMQNTPVLSAPRVDHDKKIGQGGFGSVYATNVQGIVAKVAHESPAIDLAHEAHILSRVSGHESIPSLHGEVERPLPNVFIEIMKYLFGFIALFFPIKPSLRI